MEHSAGSIDAPRRSRADGGTSLRRLRLVAALDLGESLRRPLFLIFAALMAWNGWLMSRGDWIFRSNSTSLGGQKAWVDSEFQIAYVFALITWFMVSFFVAVAAGMPLIRDAEHKVGELLHATPLRPGEYVWGKLLAAFLACLAAVAVLPLAVGVFSHFLQDVANPDMYGPFVLLNYVRPFLVFLVPAVLFAAGMAFAIGAFTGRPILVFLFPIGAFLLCENLFWRWRPPDLNPAVDAFLRAIDPSGFRWLRQTWLTVDRGLAVYNDQPVGYSTSVPALPPGVRAGGAPPGGPGAAPIGRGAPPVAAGPPYNGSCRAGSSGGLVPPVDPRDAVAPAGLPRGRLVRAPLRAPGAAGRSRASTSSSRRSCSSFSSSTARPMDTSSALSC